MKRQSVLHSPNHSNLNPLPNQEDAKPGPSKVTKEPKARVWPQAERNSSKVVLVVVEILLVLVFDWA